MASFRLNNCIGIDAILIPGVFFDRYLPSAKGTDVKVYLYLLRAAAGNTASFNTAAVSDTLDMTENELLRSLSYWEKAGLLRLSFNSEHLLDSITINEIPTGRPSASLQAAAQPDIISEASADTACSRTASSQAVSGITGVASAALQASSGSLTSQAVSSQTSSGGSQAASSGGADSQAAFTRTADGFFASQTAAAEDTSCHLSQEQRISLDSDALYNSYLCAWQEQYFPQPFTHSDEERIGYWYLQFNSSVDIMDYLFDYCAGQGHPNTSYISKVAMEWHRKGLRTLADIRQHNQQRKKTVGSIMKAYGLYNQSPAPAQLKYFEKWISEYGFSAEMIVLACDRTMEMRQRPDLKYTDGILVKWKNSNLFTPEAVKEQDTVHRIEQNKKAAAKNAETSAEQKKAPSFNNFKGRGSNYTEKILKQYSQ